MTLKCCRYKCLSFNFAVTVITPVCVQCDLSGFDTCLAYANTWTYIVDVQPPRCIVGHTLASFWLQRWIYFETNSSVLNMSWLRRLQLFQALYKTVRISQYLTHWGRVTHICKLQWNCNRNFNIFIHENAFKSVVCDTTAILSRPQCVEQIELAEKQETLCNVIWHDIALCYYEWFMIKCSFFHYIRN